jgi:cytochrome c biogenesis protein CcmG, thiol:disulfide interchange protein DsbE
MNTSFRKAKFIAAAGGLLLAAAAAFAGLPREGDPFPDLARYGLEGTVPDLHGKVVIIDFFASWCGPCKESFPVMEELYQKYGPKGLVIVAVNVDKNKADMEDFLKKHPVTFVTVRDASNKLVSDVKIPTMPSSFLLDRDGKVAAFHRGFKGDETRKQYMTQIESLLK